MNPDICKGALTKNPNAKSSYTAKFKDGMLRGENFANAIGKNGLFVNKYPDKCPIHTCIIDKENCLDPDMSGLVNAYPTEDKKTKVKNILLYANTTNGPSYD